MKKIIAFWFINISFILAIFSATSPTFAQPDKFDYSTTVGLILQVETGGHIFQRPDYDEPRNFFIIIYGIVGKYAIQMQPQHAGLTLDISSLPIEEKILLINHEAQKSLFLGDHWIGDGEHFSIMESGDYHRLRQLFAETRKHRGKPTDKAVLDMYSEGIHKLWADDPEEFYREFYFPGSTPLSADTRITEVKPELNTKEAKSGSDEGIIHSEEKSQKQRAEEHQRPAATSEIKPISGQQHPNRPTQQKMLDHPIPDENVADAYFKPWLWIMLLIALLLAGYWRRRSMK